MHPPYISFPFRPLSHSSVILNPILQLITERSLYTHAQGCICLLEDVCWVWLGLPECLQEDRGSFAPTLPPTTRPSHRPLVHLHVLVLPPLDSLCCPPWPWPKATTRKRRPFGSSAVACLSRSAITTSATRRRATSSRSSRHLLRVRERGALCRLHLNDSKLLGNMGYFTIGGRRVWPLP